MNRPIVRLFGLVVMAFALLLAFTSRWTIFDAASLRSNAKNTRAQLAALRIARGEILAADGQVLARSVRKPGGIYERTYPSKSLFEPALGYSYLDLGSTGIERYRQDALTGEASSGLQRLLNQLGGSAPSGDTVQTTLVPAAQEAAVAALAGREGAVVALDPRTGAVEAMASTPSFDPTAMRSPTSAAKLNSAPGAPLVNRATMYGYAPGSTFKVVTATAAIDSGRFTPQSTFSGRDGIVISGVPLHNDENDSYGQLTLSKALALSVNTVYAQLAERVGKATLQRYMRKFGFEAKPQLDYPASEMTASGEYFDRRLTSANSGRVDLGRLGIGQDHMQATPLQMAQVAAAVANGGRLMAPHLVKRIIDKEGRTVQREQPRLQSVVMKRATAAEITQMMEAVVTEGTGTAAQIAGMQVAGKTGTAETELGQSVNNAWFIAFAPAANPTVAVAATVAKVPGYGATYALPVAKQVMEALLR